MPTVVCPSFGVGYNYKQSFSYTKERLYFKSATVLLTVVRVGYMHVRGYVSCLSRASSEETVACTRRPQSTHWPDVIVTDSGRGSPLCSSMQEQDISTRPMLGHREISVCLCHIILKRTGQCFETLTTSVM